VEGTRKQTGRRAFLKAGGIVAATGALGSMGAFVTGTGEDASRSGNERKRARWIKAVSRPTLGETNADYKRFSGFDMFALYPSLKTQRDGAGSFEAEQASKDKRLVAWTNEKKPGFSLPDQQLSEGAWTVMRSARPGAGLLSWTRPPEDVPTEPIAPRYTAAPEEMANTVKAAARLYGARLVGIAPMNEAYVNLKVPHRERPHKERPPKDAQQKDAHSTVHPHEGEDQKSADSLAHHHADNDQKCERGKEQKTDQPPQDKEIVFADVDVPEVTDAKFMIPRKMKWVVAIAIPMDIELLARTPTPLGDAASALGYSHSAFVVSSLAVFIRGLGYEAIPCVNDTAQSIPFALDAGLGELSRLNKLVTPDFGPAVRLCKVFTDMPMACDKPVDFGLVEFCKTCKKCAEACPSRALSFDDEPSFKTKGPWNNPGHKTWYEDSYKCYQYWQKSGSACGVCLASCPYTKGDQAWIHNAVKATASIAPAADGVFRIMDNAFGYGKQHDPEQWWTKDSPSSRRG
jgi:reductive dehalogenase